MKTQVKRKHRTLVVCAALGGFLFGYDTAVVNGALFQLKTDFDFDLNSWQSGLIVSIAIVGAFLGSLLAAYAGSAFGRRRSILVADVLFAIGSLILCVAPIIEIVYLGRFILGLGIGLSSVVVPVYLAELSSPATRGAVVATNTFVLTGAQCIAASLSALMIATTNSSVGWRILFGLGAVPAIAQMIAIQLFLPETPRWLIMKGRKAEAQQIESEFGLDHLAEGDEHSDGDIATATSALRASPAPEYCGYERDDPSALATSSNDQHFAKEHRSEVHADLGGAVGVMQEIYILKSLFTVPSNRSRLVVGAGLQAFQQLAGINTIMYYSGTILKDCGFQGDKSPVYWSVPLAATNALFTVVGIWKVDTLGRRKVLLASLSGCLVTTTLMSLIGFTAHQYPESGFYSNKTYTSSYSSSSSSPSGSGSGGAAVGGTPLVYSEGTGYFFLAVLFGYLASFAPGMGPIPWVTNAEIYPTKLRTASAAVATMANWGSNAVVSQLFPIMLGSRLGVGGTFLAVAVCVAAAIAFVALKVPETKGKSLEEIDALFEE